MKLLKKYHSLSAPVKASMWFLVCSFLQKGVSFLTTPVFTRLLSPEQYGVYNIYLSWYSIVSVIAGLNLTGGVYVKGLVKHEDDQNVFSSSMLGLSITSSLVCMAVYYLLSPFINKLIGLDMFFMTAMFMAVFLSNAYSFWANRERTAYRYKALTALTCIRVVAGPALGIVAVVMASENLKVQARVAAIVVSELVFFGWVYFYLFKRGKKFYHKEYWKYALAFNLPLIPHYLSKIILAHCDKIMISNMMGDDKAGLYSVANACAHLIAIFNTSILNTMNPWVYRSMKEKKYSEIRRVSNIILILLAALNLFVIAFGPEVISIMGPPEYSSAVWVIPPAASSIFFMFVYNIFITIEFNFDKTKFVMIASVSCAVVNIVLNYVFLSLFKGYENGFVAAAYTTAFCYVLLSVAHFIFMKKTLKKHLNGQRIYKARDVLIISAAFVLLGAALALLYPLPLVRYAVVAAMVIIAVLMRKRLVAVFKLMKNKT